MTRDRVPSGTVLQSAYGVLDKYKISRSYFVQTDQTDCEIKPPPVEAIDPPVVTPKPTEEPVVVETIVENEDDNVQVVENLEDDEAAKNAITNDEVAIALHAFPISKPIAVEEGQ